MSNVRKTFSKKVKQAVDKQNIIKYNVKSVGALLLKESAQQKILKTSKKWLTLKRSYDNI